MTSALHAEGPQFDSGLEYFFVFSLFILKKKNTMDLFLFKIKNLSHSSDVPVAQRIRHLTTNQGILGSNPSRDVFFTLIVFNKKKNFFKIFTKMTDVGFEPTHPKILVPKTSALDHSANQSSAE